jgi:hypothetical protein
MFEISLSVLERMKALWFAEARQELPNLQWQVAYGHRREF